MAHFYFFNIVSKWRIFKKVSVTCFLERFEGERVCSGGWFRAPHDQRLAAGPRQGHSVLDPEKCECIFPFFYIALAQKNYRLRRYVAEQLQLKGERRNSVL